jgi:hypothetical protein
MAMDQRLPVIELKSKLEEQVELINKNLHCAYHQVLQSQKFDQEQPIKDSLLMGIVNVKNMENNLKTLTERLLNLSKDHLNLKDANLNLKEENLGLRQKIWDWERSSHFSRQEESNFKEKVECAVKQKEEELAACGKKLEVLWG